SVGPPDQDLGLPRLPAQVVRAASLGGLGEATLGDLLAFCVEHLHVEAKLEPDVPHPAAAADGSVAGARLELGDVGGSRHGEAIHLVGLMLRPRYQRRSVGLGTHSPLLASD